MQTHAVINNIHVRRAGIIREKYSSSPFDEIIERTMLL